MKNKTFKSENKSLKLLKPTIINILAIAGILANAAGLFVAILFSKNHQSNILLTAICLGFQLIVFLFRKKIPYSVTGILLTVCCANILFPLILLADKKGLNSSFVFFLFIAPIAYGVVLTNKKWIWASIATLIEYLWVFTYINRVIYAAYKNIYLYNISFSIGYLFVFFFTFFFANATFEYNKKLIKMSYHDELTDLYNRRKLDEDLQSQKFRFAVMIDIDNFHEYNNSHGHQFGDLCLKKLASICLFASCDEFKVYRYGGEEFVILSRLSTMETIKKIRDIQNLYYEELEITLSIGIAQNADYLVPLQVLKKADENMFFVKHNGKNNISLDGINLIN